MPQAAKAKTPAKESKPGRRRKAAATPTGDLESLVGRLLGEVEALRIEVATLRTAPESGQALPAGQSRSELVQPGASPELVEEAADAVLADMVQQMSGDGAEDASRFLAEMEFAIANPDPEPMEPEDGLEEATEELSLSDDEIGFGTQGEFNPDELEELIRAFERHDESAQSAPEFGPDNEGLAEDGFETLLAQEGAAIAAESDSPNLGSDDAAAPLTPEALMTDPAPCEEDASLSQDEIAALLSATAALGEPAPVAAHTPAAHEVESTDGVLSAEEIQAMLGLKEEEGPDLSLVHGSVPQADPDGLESEDLGADFPIAESEISPEPVLSTAQEPDWDAIDPTAVLRTPADLAVAALAVPVCCVDDKLYCLCVEPIDDAAIAALAKAVGMEVVPRPAPLTKVVNELRSRYGGSDAVLERTASDGAPPASPVKGLIDRILRRHA